MNLVTKLFLFILLPLPTFAGEGTVFGNLIQEIEVRNQYDFDQNEYNNALRFKLGVPLGVNAKNKLFKLEENSEKSKGMLLKAEINLVDARLHEKIKISKDWESDLSKAYRAYREYLKSNPSSARSSVDIDVNEILIQAEEISVRQGGIDISKAFEKEINPSILLQNLSKVKNQSLLWSKNALNAENPLIQFIEFSYQGKYEQSEDNKFAAHLSFKLPLFGLTGSEVKSRNSAAVTEYKIKTESRQRELQLKQVYNELRLKKKLYVRLQSKLLSKRKIKNITSAASIGVEDKVKIYLDAVKIAYKFVDLKYEIADLYNKLSTLVSGVDETKFIGLE